LTQKKQKVKAVEVALKNKRLRQSHQEVKAELPSATSAPSLAAGKLLRALAWLQIASYQLCFWQFLMPPNKYELLPIKKLKAN
jgi:hypothetical protein